jgi:hypothetical protein
MTASGAASLRCNFFSPLTNFDTIMIYIGAENKKQNV